MSELWNHNTHYHPLVLRAVPKPCARALDIGCGEGLLASQLAPLCRKVIALDLHDLPRPALASSKNVTFQQGDALTCSLAPASFDLITAVAVLHPLPLRPGLERMRDLLAPGGTLVIVGLYCPVSVTDHALNAIAFAVSHLVRIFRGYGGGTAPLSVPRESLQIIRETAHSTLPGASVQRKLFFRYALIWKKPANANAADSPLAPSL